MFCKKCGKQLPEGQTHCPYCTPVNNLRTDVQYNYQPAQVKPKNTAKIFSIIGFVFSFFNGLTGLILSAIGLGKYKKQTDKSLKGMAIAGVILSILKIIANVVLSVMFCLIIFIIVLIPSIGSLITFENFNVNSTITFQQGTNVCFQASHVYATVVFNEGEDNEDSVTFNAASTQAPGTPEVFEIGEVELTEAEPTYSYTVKITNDFTEGVNVTVDFTKVPYLYQDGYTLTITSSSGEEIVQGENIITINASESVTITVLAELDSLTESIVLSNMGISFELNRAII